MGPLSLACFCYQAVRGGRQKSLLTAFSLDVLIGQVWRRPGRAGDRAAAALRLNQPAPGALATSLLLQG